MILTFDQYGIAMKDLYLIHLFFLFALFKRFCFTKELQELTDINHNLANVCGMHKSGSIFNDDGELYLSASMQFLF